MKRAIRKVMLFLMVIALAAAYAAPFACAEEAAAGKQGHAGISVMKASSEKEDKKEDDQDKDKEEDDDDDKDSDKDRDDDDDEDDDEDDKKDSCCAICIRR